MERVHRQEIKQKGDLAIRAAGEQVPDEVLKSFSLRRGMTVGERFLAALTEEGREAGADRRPATLERLAADLTAGQGGGCRLERRDDADVQKALTRLPRSCPWW
jgi:hypothetical protein